MFRKRKVRPVSEAPPPPDPAELISDQKLPMTAVEYKEKGNKYFVEKKYDQAVQCYTKCILKDPTNPVYFNNRAITEMKLQQYEEAAGDYQKAIELDPKNTKAHFCLGKALCLMNRVNEGVEFMKKAIELPNENILWKNEMINVLDFWESKIYSSHEEDLINFNIFLSKLILDDQERQISNITSKGICDDNAVSEIKLQTQNRLTQLNQIFIDEEEKLKNDKEREIPDYLCCKISLDIFRDPVITPSGVTFDRQWIEYHLHNVGHFDPFTRTALLPSQLIPNLAMKGVVDNFLANNEWARRL